MRRASLCQLERGNAQTPDIRGRVVLLLADHLGRHPAGCADEALPLA